MRLIDAKRYEGRIKDIIACWNISPCLSEEEKSKSIGNLRLALNVLDEIPAACDPQKVINDIDKHVPGLTNSQIMKIHDIVMSGGAKDE